MKLFLIFVMYFFANSIVASKLEVFGPCSVTPQFVSEEIQHNNKKTLGDFTVEVFEKNGIPFVGSRRGMASIFNSPTGEDAIEYVSKDETRYYGWCVQIDGFEPGEMPDQIFLENSNSKISWFYAFATFFKGEWIEMCVPSYTEKSLNICRQ